MSGSALGSRAMTRTVTLIALSLLACSKGKEAPSNETSSAAPAPATPAPTTPPASEPAEPPPAAEPESIDVADVGLATPESILHDEEADVYLVSNINGNPTEADDNGFISRMTPDGKIAELKWIDGTRSDVKLNAPKGTAILGDTLYVADLTVVRKFDQKTGAPKGEIAIKGASFLNDMVSAGGAVYVTDSGLKPDFKPSGTDAVYKIDAADKVTPLIKDKELGAPNGLASHEDDLWVVTFGTGEAYKVGADGKRQPGAKLPKGQLDGVIALPDGTVLVSSWEGKAVFQSDGDSWKELVTDVESPADIGYDAKRKRVLIPLFMGNGVAIRAVK